METLLGLVESKKKSLIIAFLLLAPRRSFTPKELSKRIGLGTATLKRELRELEKQGMVKTFVKHRQTYYMIRPQQRLLADIAPSLLKNQRKYEDELYSAIRGLGKVRAAFLSGVFTGHPELPVDVLLVGKVNANKLEKFLDGAKALMGNEINYTVMSEQEFRLRRDTFDRFIKDVFDYPNLVVVDHVSQKPKKGGKAMNKKFKVVHF